MSLIAKPLSQNIHQLRRAVPVAMVPRVVKQRLDRIWENEEFRASQVAEMEFLLGRTERASEVEELAYAYAEQMMIRAFMRWHPRAITRQRVKGIEWLTTRRDPERSVILSITHHHRYEGLPPSLNRLGAPITSVVAPEITRPEAGAAFAQHLRVAGRGGPVVPASGGTKALAAELKPGVTMLLAPDFPGRTPVTWLGRRVLGSFGNARLATMTNSQIVLATHRRDHDGPYIQLDPPIEPTDYAEPEALLDEILRRHGEAVLDWPEAFESPRARFGELT